MLARNLPQTMPMSPLVSGEPWLIMREINAAASSYLSVGYFYGTSIGDQATYKTLQVCFSIDMRVLTRLTWIPARSNYDQPVANSNVPCEISERTLLRFISNRFTLCYVGHIQPFPDSCCHVQRTSTRSINAAREVVPERRRIGVAGQVD
ncbi:uncharacterized protein ZBAI_01683 [Zygosaccharomyces bailii ISA1307]|nr:uncharacterized protein ZBAI_01683 [Zygosaccharomyces bailii ISA1307]